MLFLLLFFSSQYKIHRAVKAGASSAVSNPEHFVTFSEYFLTMYSLQNKKSHIQLWSLFRSSCQKTNIKDRSHLLTVVNRWPALALA